MKRSPFLGMFLLQIMASDSLLTYCDQMLESTLIAENPGSTKPHPSSQRGVTLTAAITVCWARFRSATYFKRSPAGLDISRRVFSTNNSRGCNHSGR
jgi:hypothetical protein